MRLAETFYKKYVLDRMYTTFTKITYKLSFPATSLEQLEISELSNITRAAVLVLLPNKTYLAALSLCIFLCWQMHATKTGFFKIIKIFLLEYL